jgi:hypothetical protein
MTDSTLVVRSVHSCTGVRGKAPGELADADDSDDAADADEPAGAGTPPGTAAPGTAAPGAVVSGAVVSGAVVSVEPAAGRPAPALPVGLPVRAGPGLLNATVPAVAAPPAAIRPASDHATAFIEIRFASGRFGIFLFLVAA